MPHTKPFGDLTFKDTSIAGGKGASLGEMTQAEIPVPPGFVVLASAFEHFLEKTDLGVEIDAILDDVDHKQIHTVENASEKIQSLISSADMPDDIRREILDSFDTLGADLVAVRSSATSEDSHDAAWAGQLDSHMNIERDSVVHIVQECWASLFTPRAIFYRFEKNLHDTKISVAVVIQKMVKSEVSGIAFSVHPVTEDESQMIIEAGWGFGDAVVSGSITPDSYVVEKNPRNIIDVNVSTQERHLVRREKNEAPDEEWGENVWKDVPENKREAQKLSDEQIIKLSDLILKIEEHYGFPCDIEWALEGGVFYITQSRPVTTLTAKNEPKGIPANKNKEIREKLKQTDCQIDWAGAFSLFHYSIAAGGYFRTFHQIFGKNLSFVYLSYTNGVATAYLPVIEYQELGAYLAEKSRDSHFRKKWVLGFKESADKIRGLLEGLNADNFFAHVDELKKLYDSYTAYQVATKTASNFLPHKNDQEIFREFEAARKYSETLFGDADEITSSALNLMVARTDGKYTKEQLTFTLVDELAGIIDGQGRPSPEDLQKRYERCGVYADGTAYTVLDEVSANEIETEWSNLSEDGVIRGNSAFPGLVTGKCRVLKSYKGAEIEDGEVLVTGMTDPNFVPLMKKAAAIITDGGGLLCHAAIVARELKKPCIIGAKIATKVLKDGDVVEVDADNGVVRILEERIVSDIPTPALAQEWVKVWTTEYCLCSIWLFGREYIESCREEVGYGFDDIIFLIEGDLATVYRVDAAQKRFALEGAKKTLKDAKFKSKILSQVEVLDKEFSSFFDLSPDEFLEPQTFRKFITIHNAYLPYFLTVLWSPNSFGEVDVPEQVKEDAFKDYEQARKRTEHTYPNAEKFFQKIFSHIALKVGLEAKFLRALLPHELLRYVESGELPPFSVLRERYDYAVVVSNISGNTLLVGDAAVSLIQKISQKSDKNVEEISGTSATKGKVQGKVRKIFRENDTEKFVEGEILVTTMTRPEWLLAMKKAAAFVTDAGGVLCHAAIVSRELKKPCIIGTKIATQVLKDGDLVEVDADNGVVRIITKA